jgi:LEA14-like dessication related protein
VVVEIRFNEVLVGRAKSEGIDLKEGDSPNRVITRIDNTEIPDWWATHIAAGEHTTWTLNVKLEAPVFGRTVSVPVTNETGMFSTHIIERINAYNPDPVGFGRFFVDITETRFSWTNVTEEQSTLSGVVLLQNSTPISLEVVNADYSLTMNGIEIGQGAAAPDIQIESDAVTEIPLNFTVIHARLGEWWPTHISNGERSEVDVEIGLTIAGNLPQPIGRLQVRLPVITATDTLQTDILRQEEEQPQQ